MRIDILTLFPAMFQGPLTESILARAQKQGTLEIALHDLRAFGLGRHRQVDDAPYGGGAGMVMRVDVLVKAIESIIQQCENAKMPARPNRSDGRKCENMHRILFTPRGKRLTQEHVEKLARFSRLLLICGHYEGVDQRIVEGKWIDEEISIGDYVLTGGELPAMVLIDAVARQIPGVLGKEESSTDESFSAALGRKLEYPHYTRPEEFRGLKVPEILLSGDHGKIEKWRKNMV